MKVTSDNGKAFKAPTVVLSTVSLPQLKGVRMPQYESCLFSVDGSSEVVDVYFSFADAMEGHKSLSLKYGLS